MSDQDEKKYGETESAADSSTSGTSEQAHPEEERSAPHWWELRPSPSTGAANEHSAISDPDKIEAAKAAMAERRTGGTAQPAAAQLAAAQPAAAQPAAAQPTAAQPAAVQPAAAQYAAAEVAAAAEPGLGVSVTTGDGSGGRKASIARKTNETDIKLAFNVDGTGRSEIETDVPFLNHMLDLFTKHGQFDLRVEARGDIDIDDHHTVEDIGICLGQTLREALGDKRGIKRYASVFVPMDEALAQVVIDMSNRPHFEYRAQYPSAQVGSFSTELVHEFLWKLALEARMTLHVIVHYGLNTHHMIEAVFKALGRALDEATSIDPRVQGVPSTKGVL